MAWSNLLSIIDRLREALDYHQADMTEERHKN